MSGHRGFTLIELLVVLAVLGLLAALSVPVMGRSMASARESRCLSNQRQIGVALLAFAADHEGKLPQTTHSTGSFRRDRAWIYTLAPYLSNVDESRVCPADPPARRQEILRRKASSYVLNDLVFDDPRYHTYSALPAPSRTLLLFILSEDRAPSSSRDHIHGGEWISFRSALNDVEPDRHRVGARAGNRLRGAANYLFGDGSATSITARRFHDAFLGPAAHPALPGFAP